MPETRKKAILVVDDEPDIVSAVRDLIDTLMPDCTAVPAGSSLEALHALTQAPIDCALVDYRMPHLDGFGFIERARRLEPGLPIVLMSAYNSLDLAAKAVDVYKVQGVLEKPLHPYELAETLRNVLRGPEESLRRIRVQDEG
jgi:CheY-like chemotaxis protein